MSKISDATFAGASGSGYSFVVYTLDTDFKNIGAVYAFSYRTIVGGKGSHKLLYIGQTGELADRLSNHEKLPCVYEHNVNCICVHVETNEKLRLGIETDLIHNHNTLCND